MGPTGKTGAATDSTQGSPSKFRVLGTRPVRHDGLDKVTGRARYAADTRLPGLLHGKVLRCPHPHARVLGIDASEALKVPGVKAVVTSADFGFVADEAIDLGETQGNARMMAENALAGKTALYRGHAVAAVAATSPHIAEEALKLIKVDYEVLPPVFDAREAMKPGARLLHENMTTREMAMAYTRGTDSGIKSNAASHIRFKRGDLERGFAEADVVVEREFSTKAVHQGYIEPQASTAQWSPDGRVTVWTSIQGPFIVRPLIASMVGVPEHLVRVVPMEIGGGFGGKIPTYIDAVSALLSKKTGCPVRLVMTRKEVFEAIGPAPGSYLRAKIGVKNDGQITAAEVNMIFEAGGFPGSPSGAAATCVLTQYRIDNLQIDAYDVVVNKPKVAPYRGPGSSQASFAVESVLDEVAGKLGVDPIELRLRNVAGDGDRHPNGTVLSHPGFRDVLEAMRRHPRLAAPLGGPNRGRGVAVGYWFGGGGPSSATLTVNADGAVSMVTGSVDIGGSRASLAMQAAEALGIAAEDVVPAVGDTDSIGYTAGTGGSRTTYSTGLAVIDAARKIRDQMVQRAALLWEVKPEEVLFENGTFVNSKQPGDRMTFKDLAARLLRTGPPVTASAASSPRGVGATFGGDIVDVEVDPETGKVNVLGFTVFQNVGQAAHPSYAEGQMQGGSAQGIGWAINEEYVWSKDGAMLNPSFLDYRMPTALDLPMIETVMVEGGNPLHPFGIRGVGEVSIVPPLAAIANAVSHAIGVRMTALPLSPPAVLEAMQRKG